MLIFYVGCRFMDNWMGKLQKQLDYTNRTYEDFAKETSISKSTLTDAFKYDKEVSMLSIFKMASVLFEERTVHEKCCIGIFSTYRRNVKVNMKKLFVIAYLNGYSSILKYLVDLTKYNEDPQIKKYAELITLFYERPRGGNPREHLLKLEKIRSYIPQKEKRDMDILCDILHLLSSGDIGNFGMFEIYKDRIMENISKHKNSDLRSLYTYWINDIWSYALLRKLKVDQFRKYNNEMREYVDLKYFPVMRAMLDLRLGESFLFTSYEKSKELTSKAICLLKGNCHFKYRIALNNLNFLKLVHNKEVDSLDLNDLHPAELALRYILKQERHKAIAILKDLEVKYGRLTPMQYCYLGQAEMDLSLIAKSKQLFIENVDYFFEQYANKIYYEYEALLKNGGGK